MSRSPAAFAAVWPMRHSVQACAYFGTSDALERREFGLSLDDVAELSRWLVRDERTQVALVMSGVAWPWQSTAARGFRFAAGAPTLDDWLRCRSELGLGNMQHFDLWQPIHLILADVAAILVLGTETVEALPVPKGDRRDARWLAARLRAGGLRFAYPAPLLRRLCDWLLDCDDQAIEECVSFVELDSKGYWHGRARAKMARRLKSCPLTGEQQRRVMAAILGRLERGDFSEQFKDQLKLALELDPAAAEEAARTALRSGKDYVRRYASWLMEHALHENR